MGAKRKNLLTSISVKYEPALVTAFGNLCQSQGTTIKEGLRRAIIHFVNEGRLPGIDRMELRENQKFGAATPVYDGPSQTVKAGRIEPAAHAE